VSSIVPITALSMQLKNGQRACPKAAGHKKTAAHSCRASRLGSRRRFLINRFPVALDLALDGFVQRVEKEHITRINADNLVNVIFDFPLLLAGVIDAQVNVGIVAGRAASRTR